MDPAAEHFSYPVAVGMYCIYYGLQMLDLLYILKVFKSQSIVFSSDIRELVELDDVMEAEDLKLGPNGGLIFCLEYVPNTGTTYICRFTSGHIADK